MSSRVIRVFISSTFKNFHDERDKLASEAFSELAEFCQKRGFFLQMIDLRWGVSREDSDEGLTMEICLNEIRRCQETSPKLNFMIMAGESYGSKLLPAMISPEEWDFLTADLSAETREALLCRYARDENDMGRNYILLNKQESFRRLCELSRICGLFNCTETGLSFVDATFVDAVFTTLRARRFFSLFSEKVRALLASQAKKKRQLPPHITRRSLERYDLSATEQEIRKGYFDLPNDSPAYQNTFIMIKEDISEDTKKLTKGQQEDRQRAKLLRERLEASVTENKLCPPRLCVYDKDKNVYVDAAKAFLQHAIQNIIQEYREAPEAGRESELDKDIREHYVSLDGHEKIEAFIGQNAGKTILLLGESGSGKSWFLKHFSSDSSRRVAELFLDEQPTECAFSSALAFLTRDLERLGVLPPEPPGAAHSNQDAEWFAKRLEAIQAGDNSLFIILDCVDKIQDYRDPEGLFFRARLPANVTLILTATSVDDLGLMRDIPLNVCEMPSLNPKEGLSLLNDLLSKRGRRLQPFQKNTLRDLMNKKGSVTALEVELLAQQCGKLHSWEEFPLKDIDFPTLVKVTLFQDKGDNTLSQKKIDTYKTLRRHALGFFALSSVGLTEREAIELLARDPAVIAEIRGQQPQAPYQKALDNIIEHDKIPMALWAMLYADLRSLLMEIDDHDAGILRLRHSRLKSETVRMLREDGREYETLLHIMREYYEGQNWILGVGNSFDANRRKVNELFPVYERLGLEDELKRALGNLHCADAYVRCEMRAELLSAFARHMPAAYRLNVNAACPVGSEAFAAKIWELLRRKDFLFRLWPDSFMPAALAELPPGVADAGTKYVFQNTRPVLSENGIFFPNLRGECAFAVSDENFVAIHSEGQIRIADMKAGILTRIAQDSIREKCFLYWTRNALTVRGERVRIEYEFSPEKMELIEQRRETCPSWDKLWELGDISTETDWRESDGYRWSGQYGESIFYRGSDGAPKWELLLCRPERSLMFRVRGKLAAFILDETILEVVDLERRVILFQSREYDAITRAEWTPSGRQLLLVLRGNILVQLEIDPAGNGSPMSAAVENYGKYQWNKYNDKLNHYGRGVYWLMFGNEPNSSMFGALSMRHGWAAIYYPSDIGNTVKIYRLKNSRDMDYAGEYFVDKVQDNLDAPLYPARDRNALIVRAKKPILFDLTSLYEKRTLPPGELLKNESQKSDLSPYSDLRERYAKEMAEKLPLRASVPPKRNFIACLRSFFQGEERHYQHIEIIDGGNGFNWLIDKENGLIHAFNQSTSVFRDMLGRRILAADSHKDGLYLLLENVPHIIEIRLV